MIRKAVGQPGQVCLVRVDPPERSIASVRLVDLDRDSGQANRRTWTGEELRAGVAWVLEAGHNYALTLTLPLGGVSAVAIMLQGGTGAATTILADALPGGLHSVTISTAGSSVQGSRGDVRLGPEPFQSHRSRGASRSAPPPPPRGDATSIRPTPQTGPLRRGVLKGAPPAPPRTIVSTGFSRPDTPAFGIDPQDSLAIDRDYYFWFEVGSEKAQGAIDRGQTSVDTAGMAEGMRLHVVLFSFENELGLAPKGDIGVFETHGPADAAGQRAVRVAKAVSKPAGLPPGLSERRLFFPVHSPATPGVYRLRCNIYFKQVLLQSRLVSIEVSASPARNERPVLETVLDYTISDSLRAELVTAVPEHRLSLMLNDNGNGTHGFRLYGSDGAAVFKNDATITEAEIGAKISHARERLREVAWGTTKEWTDRDRYRYEGARSLADFRTDLIRLARAGFRIHDHVAARLAKQTGKLDGDARDDLAELMRRPGRVQIAAKASAGHVLPAALFYDRPFADGQSDETKFSLCPVFEKAFADKADLLKTPCFNGDCPTADDKRVVCPSGFWGYRHSIGFPTTESLDAPLAIPFSGRPGMLAAVSTDPAFVRRDAHLTALKGLVDASRWHFADTVDGTFDQMRKDEAQVVYFYCHGGWHSSDSSPYLVVGPKNNTEVITRGELRNERIRWKQHPPLVFINGCHTTALDPESASDLVSGFRESNAVGVIGTEITIFEPLACAFGEKFMERFLSGHEVGDAVKRARVDLLQQGNPLGLVYVPFVLASVKLRDQGP